MLKYIYIFIIILLLIISISAIAKILIFRRQFCRIADQLKKCRDANYDKQLTIDMIDNKMNEMVVQINKNLVYQKDIKIQHEKNELEMKQSLANLAHDLRTPVTALNGYIQLIKDNIDNEDKRDKYINICSKKIKELKLITTDFFDLAFIKQESENPSENVNIVTFFMDTFLQYEGMINDAKIKPNIELPNKSLWVMANCEMLRRIIGNLVSNAVKYAENEFTVQIYENEGTVNMEFSNYVGYDIDFDIKQLFNRTYKGNQSRNSGGTGLGLHIVQVLSERQGAKVKAAINNKILSIIVSYPKCINKKDKDKENF